MTGAVHRFVRRWWAGEAGTAGMLLDVVTAPAELAYRLEISRRARAAERHPPRRVAGLRVVSVGNLSVGGTGKTPMAAWAARTAAQLGARPALLARGYGEDELLLHARWNPDVPVLAGRDRVARAMDARDAGRDVVVLDDGFQHRRLARDLDLVLLAAEDRFPGRLLPRGPYREPASALARADGIVVTRRIAPAHSALAVADAVAHAFPEAVTATLHLAAGGWVDLGGGESSAPEGAILAVAGIARPEDFAAQLSGAIGERAELVSFPDHHEYSAHDVEVIRKRAGGRTLVTTEKDAVKLDAFQNRLPPVRVLRQEPTWESGGQGVLDLLSSVLQGVA